MNKLAIGIVINAYNQLYYQEKLKVFKHIEEDQSNVRIDRLLNGEDLEFVTEIERMTVDIIKTFNYKS